ncbi:10423_t:CDS:10 [Dentiscutata erythropus]|uniref:10423_t:CDS:1 n=1 Tax=Dentiscutata erythropus TaxID=1348616 RepID=A0A9N8ZDV3_9GLOM|nr:10423_t:CDS:10 [Dentiscutata erythropus]
MPSVSSLNAEDKAAIKKVIKNTTNKILTATVVRLYVAYPNPDAWTYSNLMGAVAFVKDQEKNSFFFRLVDLMNNQGILWEQELYKDFKYNQECPFFHTFCSDDYFAAFSFANENDAKTFYKKVTNREKLSVPRKVARRSRIHILKTTFSSRHLGHIGFNPDTGFDVQNIDPQWKSLFDQLSDLGISQELITQNADYIMKYVDEQGGIKKINKPTKPTTGKSAPGAAKKTPPPPPPSRRPGSSPPVKAKAKSPPPPPPARRSVFNNQSNNYIPSKQQSPPSSPKQAIPPPTLKQTTSHLPLPPPLPVLSVNKTAQPSPASNIHKPVQPPPVSKTIQPPPKPVQPHPVQVAPPPPPPPVCPPTTQNEPPPLPPARVQTHVPPRQPTSAVGEPVRRSTIPDEPQSPTAGGNDLASALANALLNRGAAIRGDSDEDEDDDDDDWDD